MPAVDKLNKTTITKLLPKQKTMQEKAQEFHWEKNNPGFGLKISKRKAVYVAQAKQKDGKTVRKILGDWREMTDEEARAKALQYVNEIHAASGNVKEEQKVAAVTLRQVLDQYLVEYDGTVRELRPKTKWVYSTAVHRCFSDWLDMEFGSINEAMVAARHKQISNTNGKRGKGEAQANQAMRILRTLFNHAIEFYRDSHEQPVFRDNPVRILKARGLWNENKKRKELIDDDDLGAWYAAVMKLENTTIRDYLLLCLFTGLRRSEAAKLTWDNVKLKGKKPMLTIPAGDTKTNSEHHLPLPPFVVKLLERRVRRVDSKYVFSGEKPGSYIIEPKRAIAKVIEQSGIDFSMHVLRRTFGTIAGRLDIGYYKHKMLMNHSVQTDVTGAHYVELSVEDLREPMQKISEHILSCVGVTEGSAATENA